MKPWRFLLCFAISYVLGISAVYFFVFSARYLQQSRLIFGGLVISMALTLLFAWIYFRGVRHLGWKARVEAVAVWFGLTVLIDFGLLIFIHGRSVGDLSTLSIFAYALQITLLFLTAYVTAREHPRFAVPDLLVNASTDERA